MTACPKGKSKEEILRKMKTERSAGPLDKRSTWHPAAIQNPGPAKPPGGGYQVKDGNDLPLSHHDGWEGARISASGLTVDEAHEIAELIARLQGPVERLEQGRGSKPQERLPLGTDAVTLAELSRNGRMLEVGCNICHRHLFIPPSSLKLSQRLPLLEVANHLTCSQCGARNTELKTPIWARSGAQISGETSAERISPGRAKDGISRPSRRLRMEMLLKVCALPLLLLIALIAVVVFAGVPKIAADATPPPVSLSKIATDTTPPTGASKIATSTTPPPMSSVVSNACPLGSVESLIESKQIQAIKAGPSKSCMQLGVADRLWQMLDEKGRQGLVLAVECSIASEGKRLPCLKLYSQQSGLLLGSTEMGKLTIKR